MNIYSYMKVTYQPDEFVVNAPNTEQLEDTIIRILSAYSREDELLPALHAIQDEIGYVPDIAMSKIAVSLNLSRADVQGVLGFYHHFRTSPPGKHVLRICRAEACQAVGARVLERHITATHGVDFHSSVSDDGLFSLESAYCLGNCALGPAMMIDNELCARVTPGQFDQLLSDLRAMDCHETSS